MEIIFLQNRLSGAFQTRLFSYKEFDLLCSILAGGIVVLYVSVYTLVFGYLDRDIERYHGLDVAYEDRNEMLN